MKMRKILLLVVVVLLIGFYSQAKADEISEKVLQLKDKIVEIQNKGKLGFRNFAVCSKIFTFASYVPLKETKVKQGGELLIYFEPANLFTNKIDGRYDIWLTQDMIVQTEGGKLLLDKKMPLSTVTILPRLYWICTVKIRLQLGTFPLANMFLRRFYTIS